MAYASADRAYYDADSHIMELPNFLKAYADPALRDDIPEVSYSASVVTDDEVELIMSQGGRHSEEHVAAQLAMGDALIENSKEIQAGRLVLFPRVPRTPRCTQFRAHRPERQSHPARRSIASARQREEKSGEGGREIWV